MKCQRCGKDFEKGYTNDPSTGKHIKGMFHCDRCYEYLCLRSQSHKDYENNRNSSTRKKGKKSD